MKNKLLIVAGIAITIIISIAFWLISSSNGLETTFDQKVKFDDEEGRVRIFKLVKPVFLQEGSPPLPKSLEGYLGIYSKFNQPNLYSEEQLLQFLSSESRKSVPLEEMRQRKEGVKTFPAHFQFRVDYLILYESHKKNILIVCKRFGPDYEKSKISGSPLISEDAQWKVLAVFDPLLDLITSRLNLLEPQDILNFIRKEPLK
jgi:hypothetical protein